MATISTALAKKLIENYVKNKVGKTITNSETRGVWFSKEDILEQLNTPVHGVNPNGLRFYFGSYESYEGVKRPPKHKEDQDKITLVIIPTTHKLDDDGKIIEHPYKKGEMLPFDLLTDPNAKPSYDTFDFKEKNDGQICPPPKTII